jgi:hypothetical protein
MTQGYFKDESGNNVLVQNVFLDETPVLQVSDNFFLDPLAQSIQVFFDKIPTALIEGSGNPRFFESYYRRVFEVPDNPRVLIS